MYNPQAWWHCQTQVLPAPSPVARRQPGPTSPARRKGVAVGGEETQMPARRKAV